MSHSKQTGSEKNPQDLKNNFLIENCAISESLP
jgi:hypothetical protein